MTLASLNVRQKKTVVMLFLIVSVLAVYWQVREFNFINLDDNLCVTQNHPIQADLTIQSIIYSFMDVHTANWHPLEVVWALRTGNRDL